MHRTINQRFKEVYEKLKAQGVFKTQREFVESLKWNQSTLSDVLKSKRPLPMKIAINFCDKYNVTQEWLLSGKGKMMSSDEVKSPADTSNLSEDEKEIIRLREIIATNEKLIDAQQKALVMAERLINSFTKKVAVGIDPQKRKS